MSYKTAIIPFRSKSCSGPYLCRDGELEICEGFHTVSSSENPLAQSEDGEEGTVLIEKDYTIPAPPLPDVSFRLRGATLSGWHIHPDMTPSRTVRAGKKTDDWSNEAKEILTSFLEEASGNNLFLRPFFVIAAWKLTDGNYLTPTPPLLMLPNSEAPLISAGASDDIEELEFSVHWMVCRLQYSFRLHPIPEYFRGKIEGLSIMASDPLQLFDLSQGLKDMRPASTANYSHYYDESTGLCQEKRLTSATFPRGWKPRPTSGWSQREGLLSLTEFREISLIDMESLDDTNGFVDISFNRGSLTDCRAKTGYIPQYLHLSEIRGAGKTIIAGRLNLWDLTVTSPEYLPLNRLIPFSTESYPAIRWVFHPDAMASEYQYEDSSGKAYSLKLTRHPVLHGSFYLKNLEEKADEGKVILKKENGRIERYFPDNILRSEKNCHDLFPDNLMSNTSAGHVLAMCRAFRASGLVATTVPTLYLFTSQGIYLLKETTTGILQDAGLIACCRLDDMESLRMYRKGVAFTADNGEELVIEGTSVKQRFSDASSSSGNVIIVGSDGETGILQTRPIKLDNPEAFKALHKVELRGVFSPANMRLEIEGSRDMHTWMKLASVDGHRGSVLLDNKVRYIRVKVAGILGNGEELEAIMVNYC